MRCGKSFPGPVSASLHAAAGEFSADGLAGTKLMAGLCLAVFAFCLLSEAGQGGGLQLFSSFRAWTTIRFGALLGMAFDDEPWRLVSAVFVHSSLLHVGMNMLGLVSFGRTLEPHLGTARFLVLFVLSGTLGYLATLWWRGNLAFSVGASGAIFGVLGATIAALLVRRNPGWHRMFVGNLILAVALATLASGIDHAAHIGGFGSGLVIGLLLELEPKPRQRDKLAAILAGILVLASLGSIVLSVRSPLWKDVRQAQEAARLAPDSE